MRVPGILFGIIALLLFSQCKEAEARKPISRKTGSFIKESVQRNKALVAEEEAYIQQLIEADTSRTYFPTKNGFWYSYIVKDTLGNQSPQVGDQVLFKYSLATLRGGEILSENEIGAQRYVIDKTNQDLINGIREGLKLMKVGETVRFLLPSHLAYGYYGLDDYIGRNAHLRATVYLDKIEKRATKN